MSDEEDEREEYFRFASGVRQDSLGQFWRYTTYGAGPGWHPAMLGRRRGEPRSFTQDLINAVLFISILLGIPAVALFTPRSYKLVGVVAYVTVLVAWIGAATKVAHDRGKRAAQRTFPHPGPKGHHVHK
ncbi:MAG: hypothetical protein ABR548_02215 [Actinomycetota bacterium]|nr:hypothetical protein [Actinomycetota bacterium]